MMKKDPVRVVWLLYSALDDLKRQVLGACLDCNAEVSAKVKSTLGRDETGFYSFFNK